MTVNDMLRNTLFFLNGSLHNPLEKLVLEPTNHCNRSCFFCGAAQSTTKIQRGFMKWELFLQLAGEAEKIRPVMVSLHAHGEPLLHPRIVEMVEELTQRGLATELTTNGDLLTPELSQKLLRAGLTHLIISHPAISPENWEACRDEPFSLNIDKRLKDAVEIWQGIENRVTLRCLVFKDKVPQKVKSAREYIQKWIETPGVWGVEFWLYQPWPDHVLEHEIPYIYRDPQICTASLQTLLISWQGRISPCPYDINGELVVGTFPDVSLQNLYNSKKLRLFRQKTFRRSQFRPIVCKSCLINRVPAVHAHVHSDDYLQIAPSFRDEWMKKIGRECWLQLVQKNSMDHPKTLRGLMHQKVLIPLKKHVMRG